MTYKKIKIPKKGEKISYKKGVLTVPDNPIIPFIEGDGIGVDITPPMINVVNQAVKIAYSGERKIEWMEVYCGEKATQVYDKDTWLPDETIEALKEYVVSIKGPLTTPVGGGIRSLNVSLRQLLDLYVCLRPIRYFDGVPSPVKRPQDVDMVIFRENSEDIYCGVEFEGNSKEAKKLVKTLKNDFEVSKIRFEENVGIGVKPISQAGTTRLVKKAIDYAIANNRTSVTLVHKGNIMKFTEGAFKEWGYGVAKTEYGAVSLDGGEWMSFINPKTGRTIVIKDVIADSFLQQILTRPADYDVIATMNLNGDYISDALAAKVGGLGLAPGANVGDHIALFEATHGTAPKYAGEDKVNPSSLILSAGMMLNHIGWKEASDNVIKGISWAIKNKLVTYDLARLMKNATKLKCSEFAEEVCKGMKMGYLK